MARVRLAVSTATAILSILAMPLAARAQTSSNGLYIVDQAASTVSFTLEG